MSHVVILAVVQLIGPLQSLGNVYYIGTPTVLGMADPKFKTDKPKIVPGTSKSVIAMVNEARRVQDIGGAWVLDRTALKGRPLDTAPQTFMHFSLFGL